jgi:hypothetical protein
MLHSSKERANYRALEYLENFSHAARAEPPHKAAAG